jgi:hypothetical protein
VLADDFGKSPEFFISFLDRGRFATATKELVAKKKPNLLMLSFSC